MKKYLVNSKYHRLTKGNFGFPFFMRFNYIERYLYEVNFNLVTNTIIMAIIISNGILSDFKTTTQSSNLQLSDLSGEMNISTNSSGLPSNSIEFVVDTEQYSGFDMEIDASSDITATITWGDGQTEDVTLTTWNNLSHTYDISGTGVQYTIRITFSDATQVTRLEFYGND